MNKKQAFLFLAEGFEEIEAITPIDLLRRAGIQLTVVSVAPEKTVVGAHGVPIVADALFKECDYSHADLLILPGGMPGTRNLSQHEGLSSLLKTHFMQGKHLGAICAAPTILAKNGILTGKEATVFPGFEHQMEGCHLNLIPVVKSENIVTGRSAGYAIEFSLKLIEEILSLEESYQVEKAIKP